MEKKTYELVTIKDIFEKVPADRIKACMNELSVALTQAKALTDLANVCGEVVTGNKDAVETVCPDKFTWVDDGKGEIETNFHMNNEPAFSLKTNLDT